MRSLAAVLRQAQWRITSSDLATTGHSAVNVPRGCELVIHSPAVASDNVELRAARALGIPTLGYPRMLGRLMRARRGVAVAGSHGKSTAALLMAALLTAGGLDPTALVGASPRGARSGGLLGRGPWLVAEACEYRRHFCHLRPEIAVILNIEWDHVDCFPTPGDTRAAFRSFVAGLAAESLLLVSADCQNARAIGRESGVKNALTFGLAGDADSRAVDIAQSAGYYSFSVERSVAAMARRHSRGEAGKNRLGPVSLKVLGAHNVSNALAAIAVASILGVDDATILAALADFAGLERRLEVLGHAAGVTVVDDYAHHPTAVAATLAAVRQAFPGRRVWAVFEPHQAVRARAMLDEFARNLQNAEKVLIVDTFLARESAPAPDARAVSRQLAAAVRAGGASVASTHAAEEIALRLARDLRPGDVLVTIGAGNIGKIAHGIIHRL